LIVPPHPTRNQHIWEFTLSSDAAFRATGMPLIFTTSQQIATLISHSAERLPTGGLVSHKFQQKIHALLPHVLAKTGNRQDLYDRVVNYPKNQPECIDPVTEEDLYRNYFFMNGPNVLAKTRWALGVNASGPVQDTSTNSLWGGSLCQNTLVRQKCEISEDCTNSSSSCQAGYCDAFDPQTDRWDVLREISYETVPSHPVFPSLNSDFSLNGGVSCHYGSTAQAMIEVATHNQACNPYGPDVNEVVGTEELLYRAVAAGLIDLLTITEDEWWPGLITNGSASEDLFFLLTYKSMPTYHAAAPYLRQIMTDRVNGRSLGDQVFELWTEAMGRMVDRGIPEVMASSLNQTAHQVLNLEMFYQASEISLYETHARHFSKRFVESAHPAGFFREGSGIDATYPGMTHWNMGQAYALSRSDPIGPDNRLREGLRRSYYFLNHTVAPEPDGSFVGGFNFAQRTGGGFFQEQYQGAVFLIEDLPEIAVWSRPHAASITDADSLRAFHTFQTNSFETNADRLLESWGIRQDALLWKF
ncbi:MAG TPA: hypothetical protein VJC18_05685, partial [bacterium]|nr:hypothetical protein [bacterium]